jgi:hypothetical protein
MKLKIFLLFCALVTLIFALGYMFIPAQILKTLGYSTDSTGLLLLQFIGVLSMGYVAGIWQVRNAAKEIQKPIVLSAFVAMGFATLVSLINQMAGTYGAIGWLGVGMFFAAFLIFGYYWFFHMKAL